jgi:hypothetical protein
MKAVLNFALLALAIRRISRRSTGKPKNGNAGYCSMWDPTWYMHKANEITTPSDCNAPFAAIGNDMLEREE